MLFSDCACHHPPSWTTWLGVDASLDAIVSVPFQTFPLSATKRTVTSRLPPAAIEAGSAGGFTSCHGPLSVKELICNGAVPVFEMRSVARSWTPFDGGLASVPMRLKTIRSGYGTPSWLATLIRPPADVGAGFTLRTMKTRSW